MQPRLVDRGEVGGSDVVPGVGAGIGPRSVTDQPDCCFGLRHSGVKSRNGLHYRVMDTLIFAVILLSVWLTARGSRRRTVLAVWTVALCATLLLFIHHSATKLPLNF